MKKIVDPFLYDMPFIDVHGFDKEYAIMKVKEFIRDSNKLNKKNLLIIHGKGKGILKKEISNYLKKEKLVASFKIYNNNDGITIVELK